jgi:hypothetical protein
LPKFFFWVPYVAGFTLSYMVQNAQLKPDPAHFKYSLR